ncbi:hypothetical protein BsWGS_09274 [Bradybaena similaris]
MVAGVAKQDEEGDGERHRAHSAEDVYTPDTAQCSHSQVCTCPVTTAVSAGCQSTFNTDGMSTPSQAAAAHMDSDKQRQVAMTEAHLPSDERDALEDVNPALSVQDAASGKDRPEAGATSAGALSCAQPTNSSSCSNLIQTSGSCEVLENPDGSTGATPHTELQGPDSRSTGETPHTGQAASDRSKSHADGRLVDKYECSHENIETAGPDNGNSSLMGGRKQKRKLGQSVLGVTSSSLGIPKQARMEELWSLNNKRTGDILQNQCQFPHKLSGKLPVKRLMHLEGRRRLRLVNDENTRPADTQTGMSVNGRKLDDQRKPNSSVPSAVTDRHASLSEQQLAADLSDAEAVTHQQRGRLKHSETQQDLWARMELLCQQPQAMACPSRPGFLSSLADAVTERPFNEKSSVSPAGVRPSSRLAKYVLAYDDDCQHGKTRAGSNITRKTSSKARVYSQGAIIKKRSSKSKRMARGSLGNRHRFRSNSSLDWSSRSRSRSHSPPDSCRSNSCDSDNCNEYVYSIWSSEQASCHWCRCEPPVRAPSSCGRCRCRDLSDSKWISRSYSRSLSRSRYKQARAHNRHGLDIIKQLLTPLVLPSSVTTLIVAPVTGKPNGGGGPLNIPIDNKHPTSSSPEKANKVNGGQNVFLSNMGEKNKFESKGSNEASFEANANMSLPPRPQNMANSRMGGPKMDAGDTEHYMGPMVRSTNHFNEHSEHNMQREQPRYEPHFNMGYPPDLDHSFSEDAGYEFYGGDYDYYDDRNEEYGGFGNEPYPPHMHQRHPGPNTYYPRRPPPQGPRGPPQMFSSNERNYGPPRLGMGGPSSRMGPNGPVGSRGPRSPMGPRGHRPQGGPGGPLGPPVMRGPPRGSPYGPPRGSPYGPPGPMRPQGMRGPPGPGMMGQAGHGGPGGPRPRLGPPARMQSPMPRQGSQPPSGPRPRMGPPPGPAPRDEQYLPPRPAILASNPGDPNFCSPMPNLSQPPPNFVPTASSLPHPSATPVATSANQVTELAEPPPPLPPPKPPTPKPPPPPKKEEEKKEEIKPMTPLIPPEQAEQYRKLREQARKHARKQQRKQEHQAKGEPESSDDDDEEKAKRKEYEAKVAAEREEMEKAALLAVQDNGALHFEEGAAILMPATQPTLIQQPTMMVQHHPLATPPSSYGLVPASQLLHTGHPGLHPSQLQNLQIMASAGQPQLVQLPNGQMAYATAAPFSYQGGGQMVAMPHQALQAGAMPHHVFLSSAGMHQVPVTAHPGLAVSSSQYMAHVMASQVQAAQIQAAQAAQIQAAQAAQIQAAQAAQVQAAQAAQVQAAQAAQVQAAQAAQVQAAQAAQAAQVQSGMPGLVPGMHMGQHVVAANFPQGQFILVPRMARPQI